MAWRAFLETYGTVLPVLEDQIHREEGLPLNWYDVLVKLRYYSPEGRLRMQALTDLVFLTSSGLTRLLDRLVEAGLVKRESTPGDRRGVYAVITDRGREALEAANVGHSKAVEEHFLRYLDDSDVKALTSAFTKILEGEKGAGPFVPIVRDTKETSPTSGRGTT